MEEDDEFGDLYTDVLKPLTASSAPPPIQPTPTTRPIDLNIHSDDEEILYGAAPSNSNQPNFTFSDQTQTQARKILVPEEPDSRPQLVEDAVKGDNSAGFVGKFWEGSDSRTRVLGNTGQDRGGFADPNHMDESEIDVVVEERDDKDDFLPDKNDNLVDGSGNLEVNSAIENMKETMIPGLSMPRVSDREEGLGDDWDDSDSEDDLQILLNDNNNVMMGMEGAEVDDDDEEGDNLVIVADNNDLNLQPMEDQEWGEDASQAAEGGERKDLLGEAAKTNGGAVAAPKIGFSTHVYHHPFHSQFKYVRPGAAPMPGAAPVAPGGVQGQVRPPVSMVPFAGRGRGDWRPTGMKNAPPMQKSFHPGFGMPVWGNNGAGRGFGSGLEFTLPSHKTIFEVDIDGFEEKPWRLQGIDISDFFNFGLNEESWKEYCKQLEQLRLESTMQSKIRVYESGRTEQEYDPDLPPELAAAAGIHDLSSENQNLGKGDAGQIDAKGSARARIQLPTGRAIQVETGFGERLPSIDTRPPRVRDSDAIIEIVLQGSADESFPGNDVPEQPDNDPPRDILRGLHEAEDVAQEDGHFDRIRQPYNDRKKELLGRRSPVVDSVQDEVHPRDRIFSEVPVEDRPDSGGTGRLPKKRAPDRSPNLTYSGSPQDRKFVDNQNEESTESVEGKTSPLASPLTLESAEELDFDQNDNIDEHDESIQEDGSSGMEKDDIALEKTTDNTLKDGKLAHSVKKQKLISRLEQSSVEKVDDGEDSRGARSSENSKARSGSSRDYHNMRESVEEEVIQAGRSVRTGTMKRPLSEDEHIVRGRGHEERQDMGRQRMAIKGKEDYAHKKWDSSMAHQSHVKPESVDRRKQRDFDGAWQREEEDPHSGRPRAEDPRKRKHADDVVSRHRSKARENERGDKDEPHLRKVLENGSLKGEHVKDMVSQQKDRDDSLKTRHDTLDDAYSKRRKDEVHSRRDHAEREDHLHVHRESTSHRKRERDEILDLRKRDEQARFRDDDQRSVRYKEEVWFQRERVERQRERDEWHRLKQSLEEKSSKREREEGRGGARSARVVDGKTWMEHSRAKEDYRSTEREYQPKDLARDQLNRRDRVDNESLSRHKGREDAYARGNKPSNDDRRSRQERGNTGTDRTGTAADIRAQEKKHKENMRKSKETDVGDHSSLAPSRRNREDQNKQRSERVSLRGTLEQGSGEHENPMNRQSSRKHKEDASSDDEQQDSRRGRSKLERWTSHKERDFSVGSVKSSDPLKMKELDGYSENGAPLTSQVPDESSKIVETVDSSNFLAAENDGGFSEMKNGDVKPTEDKHLDTVEKLKKRSERFKLPMPGEKEAVTIKKTENETLLSAQPETRTDSEIKQERPARKRRWTSS